jgi:hypothetical protein
MHTAGRAESGVWDTLPGELYLLHNIYHNVKSVVQRGVLPQRAETPQCCHYQEVETPRDIYYQGEICGHQGVLLQILKSLLYPSDGQSLTNGLWVTL